MGKCANFANNEGKGPQGRVTDPQHDRRLKQNRGDAA
jgi:hypothetical protein